MSDDKMRYLVVFDNVDGTYYSKSTLRTNEELWPRHKVISEHASVEQAMVERKKITGNLKQCPHCGKFTI